MWEHSPTRRKENELAHINRGVNSPINCLYLLYYRNLQVAPHTGAHVAAWPPCHLAAPHTGAHVAAWPPCHLAAPRAPPARATRALPRGLSPRVATRVGPARQVSRRIATSAPTGNKTPFFAIFVNRNNSKK